MSGWEPCVHKEVERPRRVMYQKAHHHSLDEEAEAPVLINAQELRNSGTLSRQIDPAHANRRLRSSRVLYQCQLHKAGDPEILDYIFNCPKILPQSTPFGAQIWMNPNSLTQVNSSTEHVMASDIIQC